MIDREHPIGQAPANFLTHGGNEILRIEKNGQFLIPE